MQMTAWQIRCFIKEQTDNVLELVCPMPRLVHARLPLVGGGGDSLRPNKPFGHSLKSSLLGAKMPPGIKDLLPILVTCTF